MRFHSDSLPVADRAQSIASETRLTSTAAELRDRIISGRLTPGSRMPSIRELARARGVSAFTAARVYDLLVAEGIVDARRRTGYFVAHSAELLTSHRPAVPEPLADSNWALCPEYDSPSVRVDAGRGSLPPSWLFAEGIRSALNQVARKPAAYAGRYGGVYGLRALRRHLTTRLARRAIDCTEDQIVLTQGASQALELCISELTRPGDSVMVDDPCYAHVLAMLRARGVRPLGIPRTNTGPDVSAVNAVASATRARVFITNTTFHNPTGTTTSLQVARDILSAARQHDFTLVEDDIFAELAPERPVSLASLDQFRRVIYIGGFSKTIAPNLRVGYLVTNATRAQKLAAAKNVMSLASSELMEQLVLSILTSGRHRTHLERLRYRLAQAHEHVARRFTAAGVELPLRSGANAIFLWARLPSALDTPALMRRAQSRGILLAPGEMFRPNSQPSGHYRFNVAHADDELLFDFIENLADV